MKTDVVIQNAKVYPSNRETIVVQLDTDYGTPETGGAHRYTVVNSLGFADGEPKYDTSTQTIQFVKKEKDGTLIPGVQDEQLLLMMLDRNEKMNALYPSDFNTAKMAALQAALDACKARIDDRVNRGVMGELKK